MKCPLLKITRPGLMTIAEHPQDDCLQEECAWWVKASGSCAVEAIPRIIGFLGAELKGIKDKMPHEEQFRR